MIATGTLRSSDDVDEAAAGRAAACLFRGMSDPSRLAILRHLPLGEHRVADLTAHLGLAQSTVSKHLACLRDCGLVELPTRRPGVGVLPDAPGRRTEAVCSRRAAAGSNRRCSRAVPDVRRRVHPMSIAHALRHVTSRTPPAGGGSAVALSCSPPHRCPTTWSRPSSRSPPGWSPGRWRWSGSGWTRSSRSPAALIILWQFRHPLPESRERRALRLMALSFFALAAYVTFESVRALIGGHEPDAFPGRHRAGGRLARWSCRSCPGHSAAPAGASAPTRWSPTPPRPCCAPTCPPSCWSAWSSTPPSAGRGPTRSPDWSSPPSRCEEGLEAWRGEGCACGPTVIDDPDPIEAPRGEGCADGCCNDGTTG